MLHFFAFFARGLAVLLMLGLMSATAAGQSTISPPSDAAVVYAADVDSIIHPVSAEYMIEIMDRADRSGAALVIFTLRTPGGLVDSTRSIVSRMLAAKTPVAIFIGPSGARAASAGFILALAADIVAMAPGTHLGAAHPVAGPGEQMDDVTSKKAAEDVAAYARTLASGRHRNVLLAEEAVNQSRAFTEEEALHASPPLIDLLAASVPDLLAKLEGRTIHRFDGSEVTLRISGATIIPIEMSLRQRVLSGIAHPNVAYILMSLGVLGLTIELWSPGAVLPGVVGGLCLLLAFFAFQLLPFSYAGLLLILFGLILFALEIKVPSFGLLTVGGLVSLVLGSMMLIDQTAAPELQLSLTLVLPVVVSFAGIAFFLVKLALSAQRQPAVTGTSGMIDQIGHALTAIEAQGQGRVATHGEIWQATSDKPIREGDKVRVTKVDGLTLTVQLEEEAR